MSKPPFRLLSINNSLCSWAMLSAGTRAAVAARNVVLLRSSLERVQARYILSSKYCDLIFKKLTAVLEMPILTHCSELQSSRESFWMSGKPIFLVLFRCNLTNYCRSTAVFGCFFGVTIFILALTRAYSPRLLLFSVFGTIVTDIIAVSAVSSILLQLLPT